MAVVKTYVWVWIVVQTAVQMMVVRFYMIANVIPEMANATVGRIRVLPDATLNRAAALAQQMACAMTSSAKLNIVRKMERHAIMTVSATRLMVDVTAIARFVKPAATWPPVNVR